MPYTPVTFGSFAGPARGRAVRSGAHDADARLGRGPRRGVRGRGPVEARALLPAAPARTCTRPWRANACAVRSRAAASSTPRRSARSRSSARTRSTFMNRLYVNAWTQPGRRAAAATACCCAMTASSSTTASWRASARDRFHVTTTTGGAARVLAHDGGLPADRVAGARGLADLDHRAVGGHRRAGTAVRARCSRRWSTAGPERGGLPAHERARAATSAACRCGCSASASPASSASRSTCRRTTARRCGRRCGSAGARIGITAYGTETMHVLRAEKGYIIVGQDTDGTVTPDDVGLAWADRQDQARLRRQALAGARRDAAPPSASSSSACHPAIRPWCSRKARRSWHARAARVPTRPLGHVTSSLLQREPRPLDRARTGRRRARAPRGDALRAERRRRASPSR